MTLPKSDTAAKGKKITLSSNRAGVTIKPYSDDHIRFGNFTNTENGFFLPGFSVVSLVSNGNGNWTAVSEVPCGKLAETGYRIYPDGFIDQWGTIATNENGFAVVPWPIPFPNECLNVTTGSIVNSAGAGWVCQLFANFPTKTGCQFYGKYTANAGSAAPGGRFF